MQPVCTVQYVCRTLLLETFLLMKIQFVKYLTLDSPGKPRRMYTMSKQYVARPVDKADT